MRLTFFPLVPVNGNHTDTEEDIKAAPEVEREYPLQRDEVKSTSSKLNRSTAGIPIKNTTNEEPNHYIGFVIGTLTVVILILVAAIVFIVFRNQRIKASSVRSTIPHNNKRAEKEIKVIIDSKDRLHVLLNAERLTAKRFPLV